MFLRIRTRATADIVIETLGDLGIEHVLGGYGG